jgi:hypothetical protein
MPEKIEETLLVVEGFKDRGTEYWPGDRVPVRHRAIRRIAAQHSSWSQWNLRLRIWTWNGSPP